MADTSTFRTACQLADHLHRPAQGKKAVEAMIADIQAALTVRTDFLLDGEHPLGEGRLQRPAVTHRSHPWLTGRAPLLYTLSPAAPLAIYRAVVFLSVLRTVSLLIESTPSKATRTAADSGTVQWPYPTGGLPGRMAISFASPSPSSLAGVGGNSRFLPSRASSKPSVTNRLRRFSIVCTRQLNASAIFVSGHPGPSASALSRIWARRAFCDDPLRFLITS